MSIVDGDCEHGAAPKRDEVAGDWRKLHSKELNILYYLLN
jgi:hypothetical protein